MTMPKIVMKPGTKVVYIGPKKHLIGQKGSVVSESMVGNMMGLVVNFGSAGTYWCLPENLSDV